MGFAGILVIMQPHDMSLPIDGLIIALISTFGVACVIIAIRQISKTEPARTTVFRFTLISAAGTGFVVPFFAANHDWQGWTIMVAITILGGAAQPCLTGLLHLAPFDYTQLLRAVALGWLIWSDVPSVATWTGAAIIIASGLLQSVASGCACGQSGRLSSDCVEKVGLQ